MVACSSERLVKQPNVLLVIVDTLRADHLPAYGYDLRPTTPFLQELQGEGELIVYEGLVASSSWTKPSVATLFSGYSPDQHNVMRLVGEGSKFKVQDNLASQFSEAGYRTACVQSNFLLTRAMRSGFDQGFDEYFDAIGAKKDPHRGSTAKQVVATAQKWLAESNQDKPWFLVVHFFDPHASFENHPEISWEDKDYDGWVVGGASTDILRANEKKCSEADRKALASFYDEEIWAVDNALRELVESLKVDFGWEETVMLFTSDHGEELGERGHIGHTQTLMTELIDVPLFVRLPGEMLPYWKFPESEGGGYAMTQIFPALLNVSGIPIPDDRSLYPPDVLKAQVDFAPVRLEHEEKFVQKIAVRHNNFQMIVNQRTGQISLYDLNLDPTMFSPLDEEHPQYDSMLQALQAQRWWKL